MRKALVLGAGGFIGSHMVKRLKSEGFWVRGVDLKYPQFSPSQADEFIIADLRESCVVRDVIDQNFDEIYQLAADMGGAGYIFTGVNDAKIINNSFRITLNVLEACKLRQKQNINPRIFYSSSACIYPQRNQLDPNNPDCREDSAYPADPDSNYGWEKLMGERTLLAYAKNYGLDVHIARYHNVFGPEEEWRGERAKALAAICRKVAEAPKNGFIEIWGDGKQTRSFLYIDECLEGTCRLLRSSFAGPVNIGSEEMVSIDELADMIAKIAGKKITKVHVDGPLGVRSRNSNNTLIRKKLGWKPSKPLAYGLTKTYNWVEEQVIASMRQNATSAVILPCRNEEEKLAGLVQAVKQAPINSYELYSSGQQIDDPLYNKLFITARVTETRGTAYVNIDEAMPLAVIDEEIQKLFIQNRGVKLPLLKDVRNGRINDLANVEQHGLVLPSVGAFLISGNDIFALRRDREAPINKLHICEPCGLVNGKLRNCLMAKVNSEAAFVIDVGDGNHALTTLRYDDLTGTSPLSKQEQLCLIKDRTETALSPDVLKLAQEPVDVEPDRRFEHDMKLVVVSKRGEGRNWEVTEKFKAWSVFEKDYEKTNTHAFRTIFQLRDTSIGKNLISFSDGEKFNREARLLSARQIRKDKAIASLATFARHAGYALCEERG